MTCTDIMPAITKTAGALTYALMLAADDETGHLLISDNAAHRVLITDYDGKVTGRTVPGKFRFPNQPFWLSAGEAAIPDTNHHRIVRLAVKNGQFDGQLGEFPAAITPYSRIGRVLPMDAKRGENGQWWILIAQHGMKNADLIRFDDQGHATGRIDLGPDSDPYSIALSDNDILVADPARPALLRVSSTDSGARISEFGDAAFRQDMAQIVRDRAFWSKVRIAAQALCVLGPVFGVLLLLLMGEPLAVPVSAVAPPENTARAEVEGIHWIGLQPAYVRRASAMLGLHVTLSILTIVLILWAMMMIRLPTPGARQSLALFAVICIALVADVLFSLYAIIRGAWRRRLGTDGEKLLFDSGRRPPHVESHAFSDCITNGRALLIGKRLIPLYVRRKECFDRQALEAYLLSRMPRSSFVSQGEFMRRALQNGNHAMWLVSILLFCIVVFGLMELFFPEVAALLKTILLQALTAPFGKALP
jgi:hypothetical protein